MTAVASEARRARVETADLGSVLDAVESAVVTTAQAVGLPGAAVGLVSGDGGRAFAAYGDSNHDHPLPVTSTTIFQAGSVSKLLTALAAVRMVDTGQLSLDQPVRTWLPQLRLADDDCAAKLTPRHLLQHTAGWRGDYDVDTGRGDGALGRMLEVIAAAPQLTPVGSTFHYNNLGFVLLGHLMATVRGTTFETVVRDLVIDPMGMERTGFFLEELAFERIAAGHLVSDGKPIVSDWARPRSRGPNGGILSCTEDLLAFAHFHFGDGALPDGTRLLSRESMELMMSPLLQVRPTGDSVGLGWMTNRWGNTTVLGHSGATLGFRSRLTVLPDEEIGLVVLTNGTSGDRVIQAAQKALRKAMLGDTAPGPGRVTRRDGLTGRFDGGIELRWDAEVLTLRIGRGPEPVVCEVGEVAPDFLEGLSGPIAGMKLDVLRDPADGSIAWLRLGGRLRARV